MRTLLLPILLIASSSAMAAEPKIYRNGQWRVIYSQHTNAEK